MEISIYSPAHEAAVIGAIAKDPLWQIITSDQTIAVYRQLLRTSITYVSFSDATFCGYVRAVPDPGFAAYISELYVVEAWRGRKIGQALIERVKHDHPHLHLYALSDEDAFYEKKGYTKVGSVFAI
ncbi:GNAT family N-acetyltransferase [Desulfofustis limnaeus]|jgi:GNAT superfamily N-acetyltransferase|uniref:N-acetyltransferase domain-containing protein n=1 Tax=Desulfofustis limnaeus TaxID=2740163 RepID=A0ABN6M0U0_9BACT|nr:GNAT family N-acetyltransferase [Desulfofustis limnaeus]MDX9895274.1 GNAT family N-acetyltransferase [Desulfofustis sp.]BDD86527.1 hypothetical protein DPPLL_08920 [Desulfofustis limnaeus]